MNSISKSPNGDIKKKLNLSTRISSTFLKNSKSHGLEPHNFIAIKVGEAFSKFATSGKAVGHALFRAQKEFITQLGYTPYLMHGYIFTRFQSLTPHKDNWRIARFQISKAIKKWHVFAEGNKKPYTPNIPIKDPRRIMEYLKEELEMLLN